MTRLANSKPRAYRSRLRAEQAEETRSRILDATLRVMAGGIASLSIPAVAREAGVSVPTVYRHFRTKDALLAATYPHILHRAGYDEIAGPATIADLRDGVRGIFTKMDAFDDLARAAMVSRVAQDARRRHIPTRLAPIRKMLDGIDPPMPTEDRDRVARLLAVLVSTGSLQMWRALGLTADQAAADVEYAISAAIAASRKDR